MIIRSLLACALSLCLVSPAVAGSHLWQINEIFSSADGTVQFIEMRECCGAPSETGIGGKWVLSDATGMQFDFPASLTGSTANMHLLLATAAFAALPGAPTPDYIIPENFFSLDADTLDYWFYAGATMTYTSGQLPLDGLNSLDRNGVVEVNSPTNFAGDSGSVTLTPPTGPEFIRGDANQNGGIEIADAVSILDALFGGVPLACALAGDSNDDNSADISDAIFELTYLFVSGAAPPAPFPACGEDPTGGSTLTCDTPACP